MGWRLRVFSLVVGLIALAAGVILVAFLCFLYLAVSLGRRRPKERPRPQTRFRLTGRHLLGLSMLLLSAAAVAAGGTYSPIFFSSLGAILLLWPSLTTIIPLNQIVPVQGSILLRRRYLPFAWAGLAEVKPGADEYTRAASSFQGNILVFTDTGRVYVAATCYALNAREAEARLTARFRESEPRVRARAFLLPLDSGTSAEVLRVKLSPVGSVLASLPESASRLSGLLVLDCSRGFARRASAFEVLGASAYPSLPGARRLLGAAPLTWEVLDSVGKRTGWPQPDSFSNLLESMLATRGIPLAERVQELETTGDRVSVRTLSGDEIHTSRAQLRALVSIYS